MIADDMDQTGRICPDFPRLGVGILVYKDDQFLLVKRGQLPGKGKWTLPGGLVKVGESLTDAAKRELLEECHIKAHFQQEFQVSEYIHKDEDKVLYHYVIVLCMGEYITGDLQADSDIESAEWCWLEDLNHLDTTPGLRDLVIKNMKIRNKTIISDLQFRE